MRKEIKIIFVVAVFGGIFGISKIARAATVTAASCAQADVQAAISAVASGDTVSVPAGSCTWTSALNWPSTKSIILQGNGVDSTVISTGATNNLISIGNLGANTYRITGFTFVGPASDFLIKTVNNQSHCGGFRVDHNKFRNCKDGQTAGCFKTLGQCYGVVDHNQFVASPDSAYKMAVDVMDDDNSFPVTASWSALLDLGGPTAVYIEDNYFYTAPGARKRVDGSEHNWNCIDTNGGARMVVRNNVFKNCYIGTHGSCYQSGHGSLKSEIYNNWVSHETGWSCATSTPEFVGGNPGNSCDLWQGTVMLGGTGLFANNVFEGDISWGGFIAIDNNRAASNSCVSPWNNVCDGNDSKDGNESGRFGYPCMDQPGLGPSQTKTPVYIWGNHGCKGTVTVPAADCITNPNGCYQEAYVNCQAAVTDITKGAGNFSEYHFVEGRDYYLSEHPAWTAYAYPHPLTLSQEADITAPEAPMGLTVI